MVSHATPLVTLTRRSARGAGQTRPDRAREVVSLEKVLPLVGILLLFWLFMIRPTTRRQKELGRMQSSLFVGDEVMLTSGVYATVRQVEDDHLLVEISEGVVIKVARGAVGTKVEQPTDELPGPVEGSEEN
jgi:preprotein translocase subunit YajC